MQKLKGGLYVFLILLYGLSYFSFAKSYYYKSMNTTINLQSNGDINVEQIREYSFDDIFTVCYVAFYKKGTKGINFTKVTDLDTGDILPITITTDSTTIRVNWNIKNGTATKRYKLEFIVYGGVKRFLDFAYLNWKVIEDFHQYMADSNFYLNLPDYPTYFEGKLIMGLVPYYLSRTELNASGSIYYIPADYPVIVEMKTNENAFINAPKINRYCCSDEDESTGIPWWGILLFILAGIIFIAILIGIGFCIRAMKGTTRSTGTSDPNYYSPPPVYVPVPAPYPISYQEPHHHHHHEAHHEHHEHHVPPPHPHSGGSSAKPSGGGYSGAY